MWDIHDLVFNEELFQLPVSVLKTARLRKYILIFLRKAWATTCLIENWQAPLTALSTALDKPIGYRGAGSPAHVNHQRWLNERPGEVQA